MLIKTIPVGQLETNCYVVTNENTLESVVIDPGDEANTILDYLESNHLKCVAILLTHGHFDHVGALRAVQEETGAAVYMNRRDDASRRRGQPHALPLKENGRSYDEGDVSRRGPALFRDGHARPHPRRRDAALRGRALHRRHALQGQLRQDRSARRRHGAGAFFPAPHL